MPTHKSAEKRILTSQKARLVNRTVRSAIRTSLKKLRGAASKEEAAKELPKLFSLLDKAARRNQGDITKNTAANYKRKAHLAVANWAVAAAAKAPSKKPATKAKVRAPKAPAAKEK